MSKDLFKKSEKAKDVKPAEVIKKKKGLYIFRVLFAILIVILIYICINFVKIFNKKGISIYEVTSGEIVSVDRHKGLIYREEFIENCNTDGYINFFVANASRVKRGAFIYSIGDEESVFNKFEFNNDDKNLIKQSIKINTNNITNYNFSNVYKTKENIDKQIDEINIVKQLENMDIDKELNAKEKGYARYAGLVSFIIDGYESNDENLFNESLIRDYDNDKLITQKKEVNAGDKVYKIITNPEFSIVFDSDYNYDNYDNDEISLKFLYENISARGRIESFMSVDGKKHFRIKLSMYPERFIDKRVVDFEIENRKINGLKIPIKSIVSKNCFKIPKTMLMKDAETDENIFYKLGLNGERVKVSCNISKEDRDFYYISIDDVLSKLRYGEVLVNRYNDTYSLSEVVKLEGVYNVNKGYAVFKNVEVVDRTNEYAIVKSRSLNGIALYDHIALNAAAIKEGDLIA